jgi:hypothetical protein
MVKKLALNLLIVAGVVFMLDFGIGRTLRHFYFKEASGLHYRTTYSMDSTKAQVLVFGASRANHSYVPEVFEDTLKKSFYNTGRDGNGIFYQTALFETILKRYTPEIVIMEYSGFDKNQVGFDKVSSLLPYYRTNPDIRKIVDEEEPYEKIKLVSEIYPFNSQALTIAVGNLDINKKRGYNDKGYVPLYGEWPNEIDSDRSREIHEIDTNKVNMFKEFIADAKNAGIKLFVVSAPLFQNQKVNAGIDKCREICAAEQVPFMNLQKDTFFISKRHLFQDILHLNNNGAIEFSKLIAGKILHYKKD